MADARIGVIGGSGLYQMAGLAEVEEHAVRTPFGDPSDLVVTGVCEGQRVAFLPRHGRGHRILPHEVNFRANIHALKSLGAVRIVSVSAVGSLKEEMAPRHVVVPDQFVDWTRRRESSFFGAGLAAHAAMGKPVCPQLAAVLAAAARDAGATVHERGTYICIDGPQFSTRAESLLYRSWGLDIIGMTALPEAKLAREAQLCYATLALVTDYDCWHPGHEDVTAAQVIAVLNENAATAQAALRAVLRSLPDARQCDCAAALDAAIVTAAGLVPAQTRERLALIAAKHFE
jgi:5'-methylthioadenosine phosphorylase